MKKILIIGAGVNWGGIEVFVYNWIKTLENKNAITLLAFDSPVCFEEEYKKMGVNIVYLPARSSNYAVFKKEMNRFFKNNSYDVIHINLMSYSFFEPILAARKYNKNAKVILHSHIAGKADEANIVFNTIGTLLIKNRNDFDRIACSKKAGEFMFENKPFTVINNKINFQRFEFSEEVRRKYREEFGIKENEILLGNVGRFAMQKNHKYLIDIFKKVCESNENYKLILCGTGELENEIKEKVHNSGLDEKVIFVGRRDDVNCIMQAMDIFVFPSLYEGLPITLVEAQANGLPMVISDTITKEAIYNKNVTQLGINENDLNIWRDKIIEMDLNLENRLSISKDLIRDYDLNGGMKELRAIYEI